jgi:hypothetical protein
MSRTFKRKRGFLVFAQNGSTDYLRLAYGLALSLKATQTDVPHLSVVITPGQEVPDRYREVFDEVIDVPWLDEASNSDWKLENEWKAMHVTPYEETIKLDADMIFPASVDHWWDILATQDVWACTEVHSYRGDVITSDYYRRTFTSNDLPNVYTAMMFFKANEAAQELFAMAEIIYHNWEKFFFEYLDETRPKEVSTDVVFALAMKLIGKEREMTYPGRGLPTFVHMKSRLQDWQIANLEEDWTKYISGTVTPNLSVKVGRFSQHLPFHYHVKEFISDAVLATYEEALK